MTRRSVSRVAVFLLFCAVLLFAFDRIVMYTVFDQHRRFLQDIDHRNAQDEIEFNRDGLRESREAEAFAPSDVNVVFLGDSFVFGHRLWPHEALPSRFEKLARDRFADPRINAVNFGWISASPFLSLRLLEQIGGKYHPSLVILCVDMTDVHDDLKYRRYDEKPGPFQLVRVMPSLFFLLKQAAASSGLHERLFGYPADRFFIVNRPLSETRKYFDELAANIEAIHRFVTSELGARFAVVVLPRHFQYDPDESPKDWEEGLYERLGPHVHEPFRYFRELGGRAPYPVHSILPAFETSDVFPTTFFFDPHWTPQGTRVAAEAILEFVVARDLLAAESSAEADR